MSRQRFFHLQRFRDWLDISIANRLTFAAVAMTMSVVGVVGLVAFIFGYLQIERSVQNELSAELELFERRLETSFGVLHQDLTSLSGNTLVSSGLLDSQGRETYLNPFLRDYRSPLGTPVTLSLHDFQGGAIAGNNPGGLPSFRDAPWVERVIAEARPHAEIFPGADGNYLLLAYPVSYPSTGRAEGMLIAELNLSKLFRGDSEQGNSRVAKHLIDGSGRHIGEKHSHEVGSGDFVLRKPLKLVQPLAAFGLHVERFGGPRRNVGAAVLDDRHLSGGGQPDFVLRAVGDPPGRGSPDPAAGGVERDRGRHRRQQLGDHAGAGTGQG